MCTEMMPRVVLSNFPMNFLAFAMSNRPSGVRKGDVRCSFILLYVHTKYEFTVTFIGSDDDGSDANRSSSSDLTIIYTP